MNKRARLFSTFGILALVLAASLAVINLKTSSKTLVIALNTMPQKTEIALKAILDEYNATLQKPLSFVYNTPSSAKPFFPRALANEKTRADLAFTFAGVDTDSASKLAQKNNAGLNAEILSAMPVSIQQAAITQENAVFASPLLMDHLAISLSQKALSRTDQFRSLDDFTSFLVAAKNNPRLDVPYPLIFEGSSDALLVDVLGAISESLYGKEIASELAALIRTGVTFQNLLEQPQTGSALTAFNAALGVLVSWKKQELISNTTMAMQQVDIVTFLEHEQCAAVIMPLSFRRTVPVRFLDKYPESIFFPSRLVASDRAITAPILYAIPLSKNKRTHAVVQELMAYLETTLTQGRLSSRSGLAPVLSQAETPDIQADDVRFWVASTSAPLASLSNSFAVAANLASFAGALRTYLSAQ